MKLLPLILVGGIGALVWLLPKKAKAGEYAGPLEPTDEEEEDAADRQTWEGSLGGPPSDSQVQAMYQAAMAPGMTDVGQLRYAYSLVNLYGTPEQAGAIAAKIESVESGDYMPGPSVSPTPAPAPTEVIVAPPAGPPVAVPDDDDDEASPALPPSPPPMAVPAPPTPLQETETQPEMDPNGTVRLARLLLNREGEPRWKSAHQAQVKTWQGVVGLTTDGKFGPLSALEMAEEVGVLPLIRYWSGWNKSDEVQKYRDRLRAFASELEMDPNKRAHAMALRASADREKGQGWPANAKVQAVPVADQQAILDSIQATLEAEEGA